MHALQSRVKASVMATVPAPWKVSFTPHVWGASGTVTDGTKRRAAVAVDIDADIIKGFTTGLLVGDDAKRYRELVVSRAAELRKRHADMSLPAPPCLLGGGDGSGKGDGQRLVAPARMGEWFALTEPADSLLRSWVAEWCPTEWEWDGMVRRAKAALGGDGSVVKGKASKKWPPFEELLARFGVSRSQAPLPRADAVRALRGLGPDDATLDKVACELEEETNRIIEEAVRALGGEVTDALKHLITRLRARDESVPGKRAAAIHASALEAVASLSRRLPVVDPTGAIAAAVTPLLVAISGQDVDVLRDSPLARSRTLETAEAATSAVSDVMRSLGLA